MRGCSIYLKAAGIEFIDENGGGYGVRLRKRQPLKKSNGFDRLTIRPIAKFCSGAQSGD